MRSIKATAKRSAKPATGKPETAKPEAPAVNVNGTAKPAEAARPSRNVSRTIATVARQATNFGGNLSDRDAAYLAFYSRFAKAAPDGTVTVRAIAESGARPAYNGSNKPHDAGVIVRLTKAGILATAPDGSSFTVTERGKALKPYAEAKPFEAAKA